VNSEFGHSVHATATLFDVAIVQKLFDGHHDTRHDSSIIEERYRVRIGH
jgi:hypothetical protein